MRIGRKLAITAALTLGSGIVAAKGTAEQHDCFNGLKNDYGVESFSEIPEKIQNDSGCVSWLNTLGSVGVAAGVTTGTTMVILDRRKKRDVAVPSEPEVEVELITPPVESRKRLDTIVPAQCLGSACVNYSDVKCTARDELLRADGETGHDKPPEIDDPTLTYAMYGTVCGNSDEGDLAGIRFTFFEEDPNLAKANGLAGMYGDLPVKIATSSGQLGVNIIATSDMPPTEG